MKFLAAVLSMVILSGSVQAQMQYDDPTGAGDYYSRVHSDPLYGLSSNPWERYATTGAMSTERTSTPWNQTTYYPTPPTDQYIGQKTTWDAASGQTEMAPEVNIHNMLVMTRYLRSLGYEIPQGFDDAIIKSPAKFHNRILSALNIMGQNQGDPISKMSSNFIRMFEEQTGLSMENLFSNSLRIIGNKPQ